MSLIWRLVRAGCKCCIMVDDDVKSFGELSKEEKLDLLKRLSDQLGVDPEGLDRFGIEGEVTIRVLDEDGDEKTVETESFKC